MTLLQHCIIPCSACRISINQELSHFSMDWAEILHHYYLGWKDEVCRQNIDPAALQYSMQRCRISNRTITTPFLIGLNWNFACLFLRCKQSSLYKKQWPCSTALFHAAHAEFLSAKNSAISQWIELKLHYRQWLCPLSTFWGEIFFDDFTWGESNFF